MLTLHQQLIQQIPFQTLEQRKLDKREWMSFIQEVETLLTEQQKQYSYPLWNILIPLTGGCILRILYNGKKVDGVVLYEGGLSHRIVTTHNHDLINYVQHEVCHIEGLNPLEIQIREKGSF